MDTIKAIAPSPGVAPQAKPAFGQLHIEVPIGHPEMQRIEDVVYGIRNAWNKPDRFVHAVEKPGSVNSDHMTWLPSHPAEGKIQLSTGKLFKPDVASRNGSTPRTREFQVTAPSTPDGQKQELSIANNLLQTQMPMSIPAGVKISTFGTTNAPIDELKPRFQITYSHPDHDKSEKKVIEQVDAKYASFLDTAKTTKTND